MGRLNLAGRGRSLLLLLALFLPPLLFAAAQGQPAGSGTAEPGPDLAAYPWVFLRDDRPLAADEKAIEVIAVGDIMLGRAVAAVDEPLAAAAAWLRAADLTLGNLESPIVVDGQPRPAPAGAGQPIYLDAPPRAARQLADAGFDLLSLANNHSLDYGAAGLAQTAGRLAAVGVAVMGMETETGGVVVREVGGVRLAFLAFNGVPDPGAVDPAEPARMEWEPARAAALVAAARAAADVVVVSLHWGFEYEPRADPGQEEAAQALFAAGADVVLGHHPHVVQPVVVDRAAGRLAAYSLGNFVFDQAGPDTGQGLALRLFFDGAGLRAAQALPLWTGPQPRLMTPAEAAPLLARVLPPPPRLAYACDEAGCTPAGTVDDDGGDGLFWSGAIDLTGDGVAEVVRRAGGQVTVYAGGAAVWQSPPAWHVVDLALGDPNDDGRFELMLAIRQTDAAGFERSQPYIVGYRGGQYQLLWGGRPVNSPILALELGDVDGDGAQELVVLEDQGTAQSVAVWRWQGWTFSLVWRGENAGLQDLVLPPGATGRQLITVRSAPAEHIQ